MQGVKACRWLRCTTGAGRCRSLPDYRRRKQGDLSRWRYRPRRTLNPFGEALYVFINRRRDKLKALYWHRNGFCLWYKRLEAERFAWPPAGSAESTQVVTLQELEWLLEGFDLWAHRPHKTLEFQSVT